LMLLCSYGSQLSLQITPPCSNEQYYEYLGRCCAKCEPGKYMSSKCTASSETKCQPCGPNEYMDIWNEEEKCLLHKICDRGKALREVHPGNSTFHRQCACTAGYHWNEDCDCCRRNTKCPPGFGVKYPVQEGKDAVCLPCPTGHFSNITSSTDECKPWTNCTALGAEEKIPGNDRSDVVCEKLLKIIDSQDETNQLFYMLVAPLLLVAVVSTAALAAYYRNKGKVLTADLQYWVNEICTQIKGTKDPPTETFVNTNMESLSGLRLLRGTYLLDLDEYSFSDDLCFPTGHIVCENADTDTIHYESGEDFPMLSLGSEKEDDHLRPVPTEDEYLDRIPQGCGYLPLLSQPDSAPALLLSEPLEVGENDSLSQCFAGTESLVDLSNCCGSSLSWGTDSPRASSDKCPQNSCHLCGRSTMGDAGSQDTGGSLLMPTVTNCPACGNDPTSTPGARGEPSDGTEAKDQNAKRSNAGSKCNTSDLPAASGNVTGNSNSTFISSGQVMNFKGEIIVVYVSQNSQEGSASPGATEGNLGSPVQEENLNRCETFAGNVPQYKEKCAEMDSYHSTESEGGGSAVEEYKRTSGPVVQEENQDCPKTKHFGNEASQPVQEEGKPEQFLEKSVLALGHKLWQEAVEEVPKCSKFCLQSGAQNQTLHRRQLNGQQLQFCSQKTRTIFCQFIFVASLQAHLGTAHTEAFACSVPMWDCKEDQSMSNGYRIFFCALNTRILAEAAGRDCWRSFLEEARRTRLDSTEVVVRAWEETNWLAALVEELYLAQQDAVLLALMAEKPEETIPEKPEETIPEQLQFYREAENAAAKADLQLIDVPPETVTKAVVLQILKYCFNCPVPGYWAYREPHYWDNLLCHRLGNQAHHRRDSLPRGYPVRPCRNRYHVPMLSTEICE
uniref:tumor necrosis factor receptor superfamily member 11A n=1 Tax=Euleptes europaea TaxID=460621 RepID=UPI002540DB0C